MTTRIHDEETGQRVAWPYSGTGADPDEGLREVLASAVAAGCRVPTNPEEFRDAMREAEATWEPWHVHVGHRLGEPCTDGCRKVEQTIRVDATDYARLVAERDALRQQRDELQARGTALVEERRRVDWTEQLRAMFVAFDQDLPTKPAWPSDFVITRRMRLIDEEHEETREAMRSRDFVEAVDGFVDLAVVALGGLLDLGVDPRPIWAEVWKTNMAKASGPVSSAGKKQKPEGWQPPRIRELLIAQGWTPPAEAK